MDIKNILEKLISSKGVSGNEALAANTAAEILADYMPTEIQSSGNVVGFLDGEGPIIMLEAHLDQIGLIVTDIDKSGFIRFAKCGGADMRVLPAADVTIVGKDGVEIDGIVISTPPHLAKDEDKKKFKQIEDLAIDVGLCYEDALKVIRPGDRVTYKKAFGSLMNNRLYGTSFDDRAGVAAVLKAVDLLKGQKLNCKLCVLFAALEETTGGGAAVGAFAHQPDESISVDVSFAESPGVPEHKTGKLGGGAMIGIAPTLDDEISGKLIKIARTKKIKYQTEVMGGQTSTNADKISVAGRGVKTGLISIPLRNMHSAVEVLQLDDVEAVAQLLAEYVLSKGVM
ncbi:MAG TPA: M20/M25/M40 family metallo-hydrolase [Clostridiales bacterium]|nr:M20/M25/M40 family metallo-hydrolase [Clostridiales bacterium]